MPGGARDGCGRIGGGNLRPPGAVPGVERHAVHRHGNHPLVGYHVHGHIRIPFDCRWKRELRHDRRCPHDERRSHALLSDFPQRRSAEGTLRVLDRRKVDDPSRPHAPYDRVQRCESPCDRGRKRFGRVYRAAFRRLPHLLAFRRQFRGQRALGFGRAHLRMHVRDERRPGAHLHPRRGRKRRGVHVRRGGAEALPKHRHGFLHRRSAHGRGRRGGGEALLVPGRLPGGHGHAVRRHRPPRHVEHADGRGLPVYGTHADVGRDDRRRAEPVALLPRLSRRHGGAKGTLRLRRSRPTCRCLPYASASRGGVQRCRPERLG